MRVYEKALEKYEEEYAKQSPKVNENLDKITALEHERRKKNFNNKMDKYFEDQIELGREKHNQDKEAKETEEEKRKFDKAVEDYDK